MVMVSEPVPLGTECLFQRYYGYSKKAKSNEVQLFNAALKSVSKSKEKSTEPNHNLPFHTTIFIKAVMIAI
jgi:hypothetical protein